MSRIADVFDLLGLTFQGADPAVGGVPALFRPFDHVHHSGVWVWGGLDADAGVGKLAGREGGFQDFLQVFSQGGPLRRDLGFYDARFLVVVAKDVHDAEAYPGFPLLFLFILIHAFHRLSSGVCQNGSSPSSSSTSVNCWSAAAAIWSAA